MCATSRRTERVTRTTTAGPYVVFLLVLFMSRDVKGVNGLHNWFLNTLTEFVVADVVSHHGDCKNCDAWLSDASAHQGVNKCEILALKCDTRNAGHSTV